ncbi:MAG: glycosyltransferase family 4 protein [Clostridiales bacterium]|nr:glycosyltransferase family 4 protein [Clostridiales bacterium]
MDRIREEGYVLSLQNREKLQIYIAKTLRRLQNISKQITHLQGDHRLKVSFFIGSLYGGGAERVVSILANHFCKRGWDVEVALMLENKVEYPLDPKIKVIDLTQSSKSYVINLLPWVLGVRRYVKTARPDRIISFIGRVNVLVLTSTIGSSVPVIISERNDINSDGRGKIMRLLCNTIYPLAAAIVFQTKYQQSCFPRYLAQKSYIIKNPIKVDVTAVETDEMTIISAGRLSPQKNQMLMIEAVSMLHEEFPKLKLEIYGDGTLRDSLLSAIEQNNLNDCVFLRGNVKNIHERMAAARLFLMTSEFEGMPNALLEAMAIGLPCITTDYPGAEEIIQNETNGLVVPRNDAKALADAIRKVLEDNVLEKKIRQNALFSSELYREEEVFKQWDAIVKAGKS